MYGQRAQVKRDATLLEGAIKKFDVIYQGVNVLKSQTTDSVNLGYLNAVESSAKVYEESLKGFIAVMQEAAEIQKRRVIIVNIFLPQLMRLPMKV